MTQSTPKKLAFQKAYNARPEEVAKRVKNNQARAELIKEGKVKVGDGKDVGHLTPLENGGGNKRSNLAVQSTEKNRGWRQGKKGSDSYNPAPKK